MRKQSQAKKLQLIENVTQASILTMSAFKMAVTWTRKRETAPSFATDERTQPLKATMLSFTRAEKMQHYASQTNSQKRFQLLRGSSAPLRVRSTAGQILRCCQSTEQMRKVNLTQKRWKQAKVTLWMRIRSGDRQAWLWCLRSTKTSN